MKLFGSQKPSYVGVDLGSGGIKLAELMNEKGRARLITYAFVERTPGEMAASYLDAPRETADLIKKMLKKARTASRTAVAGLPVSSVFSSIISVQKTAKKEEMQEAVRGQAKKLIPLPLEEMSIDWKPLAPSAPDGKDVQVLLTGAPRSLIGKYKAVFEAAGLELASLETEALALVRSLVGRDRSPTMLLDIGSLRTNILIVESGVPFVSRSVGQGGFHVTKEIAAALGLPEDEAEHMKIDASPMAGFSPDGAFPKVLERAMAPILTELTYSSGLFLGEGTPEKRIDKIILTGGGALLPHLPEYLSKAMNLRVYVGDPWARVVYPEALKPVLGQIGPRFGVPVGLAMRDID